MSARDAAKAQASQLPWRDGDGYAWGGEAVLTIGDRSIMIGAGKECVALAQEIARRWNAFHDDTPDTDRALASGGKQ